MRVTSPFCLALGCLALLSAMPRPVTAQDVGATAPRGVPFLTVRDKTDPDGSIPGYGDGRSALSAGYCDVEERRLGALSAIADAVPFSIDDELLAVTAVRGAPPEQVLNTLEMEGELQSVTLFTHGFYIDFEKGCRRATVVQEKIGVQGRFVWFSWPSDGNLLNYAADESDLAWSVPDMADAIARLEEQFGPGRVNVMGHSLGGRGMALAVYDLAARHPDVQLGELVLLAPDMDFDIFRKLLPRIRPIVSGITVYTSDTDRPLAVSEQLHGYPRLGQAGNDVSRLDGVEVIDLSELPVNSPTGHLYHIHNDEVGADLFQLLHDGARADARRNLMATDVNLWSMTPAE